MQPFEANEREKCSLRRSVYISLVAMVLLALPPPAVTYERDVKNLSDQIAQSLNKTGRKTVAVVDFTDLQGNVTELGRFLAERFSVDLASTAGDFEVVDRTHLKAILQEHKLAATGIIDPQTARKLGEIAGVEAIVTGTITPFGDSVNLSVKALDASTAKMLGAATADIPKTKAIEELLARGISETPGPSSNATGSRVQPPETAMTKRVGDLLVALRSCKRTRETVVTCAGLITNKGAERGIATLSAESSATYAIDNLGNQSDETAINFGARSAASGGRAFGWGRWTRVEQELEPGVPMNFAVFVSGISPQANSLTLFLSNARGEKLVFYNIPLQQR